MDNPFFASYESRENAYDMPLDGDLGFAHKIQSMSDKIALRDVRTPGYELPQILSPTIDDFVGDGTMPFTDGGSAAAFVTHQHELDENDDFLMWNDTDIGPDHVYENTDLPPMDITDDPQFVERHDEGGPGLRDAAPAAKRHKILGTDFLLTRLQLFLAALVLVLFAAVLYLVLRKRNRQR